MKRRQLFCLLVCLLVICGVCQAQTGQSRLVALNSGTFNYVNLDGSNNVEMATGETSSLVPVVGYAPAVAMTALGTDGTFKYLLIDANGNLLVNCSTCSGGSSITLKTNGTTNGSQTLFNLVNGLGIGITQDGAGNVTVANTNLQTQVQHAVAPDAEWAFLPSTVSLVSEADITGNGNTATFAGSGMTRATNGGVNFTDAGTLTTPITVWKSLVVKACPFVYTTGTQSGANPMGIWGSTGTGTGSQVSALTTTFALGTNSLWVFNPGFYDTGGSTSAADLFFGCHVYTWTLDSTANKERLFVDGAETSYANQGANVNSQLAGGRFYQIGAALGGSGFFFSGTITYAYVYKTATLTPAQVAQETAYVNSLRPSPVYDPYNNLFASTRTATFIAVGDSKTEGVGGGTPYTSGITFNNTYAVTNLGSGGDVSSQEGASHPYRVYPKMAAHARNLDAIWLGSNDIALSLTAVQSWQNQLVSINADLANGVEVFFLNQDGGSTSETAYANYFRQQSAKMGPHFHLVDLPQNALLGATGASSNLTYYEADATHLTNAGYALVKTAVQNAVNAADGSSIANPDLTTSTAFVGTTANNYVIQTPASAATHQLVDCIYFTGWTRTIVNGSAVNTITVSTTGTGSIVGNPVVAPNTTATFTAMLTATSTGGCYWQNTTPAAAPLAVDFSIGSGVSATDAAPRQIMAHAGTLLACYVLTTTSDASTALTLNIFDNGSTIFSGGAQTVSAGTAAGTLTTLGALTTAPLNVANNDKISINITSGASDWIFSVQCK